MLYVVLYCLSQCGSYEIIPIRRTLSNIAETICVVFCCVLCKSILQEHFPTQEGNVTALPRDMSGENIQPTSSVLSP